MANISTVFIDVGGVLLTNGWDRHARKRAVERFHLDESEVNKRHDLYFDIYEIGKITLDTYIEKVYLPSLQAFTLEEFKQFMFAQSQPYYDMIEMIRQMKAQHGFKLATLSNEGKELACFRFREFHFKDFFVVSSFVGVRKPDSTIYRIALDLAQAEPHQAIYIDDRRPLAEMGQSLGLHSICHENVQMTKQELEKLLRS
jgi:putative hydrolase of the HAD superfamily